MGRLEVLFVLCSVTLTTKAFLRPSAMSFVTGLRGLEFVCVTFLEVIVMDDIEELKDSDALPRLHVGFLNTG